MPTLDFTPATLNLNLQAGDDATIVFTFDSDLTGYTEWLATIKGAKGGSWDWTVDDADQASDIITLDLDAASTGAMFGAGHLRWQFQVTDPDDKIQTLMGGTVTVGGDVIPPVVVP